MRSTCLWTLLISTPLKLATLDHIPSIIKLWIRETVVASMDAPYKKRWMDVEEMPTDSLKLDPLCHPHRRRRTPEETLCYLPPQPSSHDYGG